MSRGAANRRAIEDHNWMIFEMQLVPEARDFNEQR